MRIFLLIIVFSINSFAQINFSQFNKIVFGDLYRLRVISGTSPYFLPNELNTHYNQLVELGVNHVATFADNPVLATYSSFKILDRNFERDTFILTSNKYAYKYSFAYGNKNMVPYEIGGDLRSGNDDLTTDNKWGFGTDNTIPSLRSFFIESDSVIGEQNFYDEIANTRNAKATKDVDPIGNLVYLLIPNEHQPYHIVTRGIDTIEFLYKAGIYARIKNADSLNGNDTVLIIQIREKTARNTKQGSLYPWSIKQITPGETAGYPERTYFILKNQFPDTNYHNIITQYFNKPGGKTCIGSGQTGELSKRNNV